MTSTTDATAVLTPEVAAAIEEIRDDAAPCPVTWQGDGSGGAYVLVDGVDLGDRFAPQTTWVRFHVTFQYPRADVYPHFIDPAVRRTANQPTDGTPLGPGSATVAFAHGGASGPATQLSRRSNRLDPRVDTAALKLRKVLAWLKAS